MNKIARFSVGVGVPAAMLTGAAFGIETGPAPTENAIKTRADYVSELTDQVLTSVGEYGVLMNDLGQLDAPERTCTNTVREYIELPGDSEQNIAIRLKEGLTGCSEPSSDFIVQAALAENAFQNVKSITENRDSEVINLHEMQSRVRDTKERVVRYGGFFVGMVAIGSIFALGNFLTRSK